MPIRTIQYSFAGGEMSPLFGGRLDINRYFSGAEVVLGYRTLPKGGAVRRDGTQFIAAAKYSNRQFRLERFEFSVTQAYILEIGHLYIRFYKDLGRIESPVGTPVEVTTPYDESDLFDLQMTQSADVMYIVHPSYPPAKLNRLSDTSWEYQVIDFRPAPLFEGNTDLATTLTPAATTGTGITFTAGSAVFLDADVDRQIISGSSRAVITALGAAAPSATVTCTILSDFSSIAAIASGSWFLTGSPAAGLSPDKEGPVGGFVTLNLQKEIEGATDLITNGNFSAGTDWDDYSGPQVHSGTHDGASNVQYLEDASENFIASLVEIGHRVLNTSDGSEGVVNAIHKTKIELLLDDSSVGLHGGTDNDFDATDDYTINETGYMVISDNELKLHGGPNGTAWAEQDVTVVDGERYRLKFTVRKAAVSVMVGSTSKGQELYAEASFDIHNQDSEDFFVDFTADGTTAYVQFRNNQDALAIVDDVSMVQITISGFRSSDVGNLIQMSGGTIEITGYTDASTVTGIIWRKLESTDTVIAGAWIMGSPAWSATNGYPRAVSFHQGRLCFAGSDQQPLTPWGSVSGDFENFGQGVNDDDSWEHEISANQMNTIEWMEPFRDLFIGTRGGEHLLTGGNNPITPSNAAQSPQDTAGSPPVRPVRAGNVLLHLQRGRRKVRELTIDADTGLTTVRNATVLADHITSGGITQWTYQRQPVETIWSIRGDGQLLGYTFELLEEVRGWHRHTTPNGYFRTVATLPVDNPSDDETEQVWLGSERTVNRATVRYIEVMRPKVVTSTARRPELTLDCALRYDGVAATTFSGLSHLEGETVRLVQREDKTITLLDGSTITVDALTDLGTQVVSGGQVTTSSGVEKLDVGLHFDARLVTLRPEIALQDGTIQLRKKRWVSMGARVLSSLGLQINGKTVPFRTANDLMDAGVEPRDIDVKALGTGWETNGRVTIQQTLPFPSTILMLVGELDIEEEN